MQTAGGGKVLCVEMAGIGQLIWSHQEAPVHMAVWCDCFHRSVSFWNGQVKDCLLQLNCLNSPTLSQSVCFTLWAGARLNLRYCPLHADHDFKSGFGSQVKWLRGIPGCEAGI